MKDFTKTCRDIIGMASKLEVNGPELLRRAEVPAVDGFGSSGDGGTPSSTCPECEGNGLVHKQGCRECNGSGRVSDRGMVSDPTAAAAMAVVNDPVGDHAARMVEALETAYKALRAAETHESNARPREPKPKVDPATNCLSCDRIVSGSSTDRAKRGMCSACYQKWLREGRPDIATFRHVTHREMRSA